MVPEWVLDADIGDCALRLYAVLLRYGNGTGARMPSRTTLAGRLHKKSVDTVDRALTELVQLGAVQVEHRWAGQQRLTNRYRIRTSRPHATGNERVEAGRVAARMRLPPTMRPAVAAWIGAGWPHGSGMTETHLPIDHHPPPPPPSVAQAQHTRTAGGAAVRLPVAITLPAASVPVSTGDADTTNCSTTAASTTATAAGTTTSPPFGRHAPKPANHWPAGRPPTCSPRWNSQYADAAGQPSTPSKL